MLKERHEQRNDCKHAIKLMDKLHKVGRDFDSSIDHSSV